MAAGLLRTLPQRTSSTFNSERVPYGGSEAALPRHEESFAPETDGSPNPQLPGDDVDGVAPGSVRRRSRRPGQWQLGSYGRFRSARAARSNVNECPTEARKLHCPDMKLIFRIYPRSLRSRDAGVIMSRSPPAHFKAEKATPARAPLVLLLFLQISAPVMSERVSNFG
ncbi:hypothetical protein ISCGN_011223 [Ixodes scapularis]